MTEYRFIALQPGTRIWFAEEKRPYTVQAVPPDRRWVACTKPFAAQHTVMYTVLDRVLNVRGVDNLVFSLGYETREQCEESIALFHDGTAAHSRRRKPIPLRIVRYEIDDEAFERAT